MLSGILKMQRKLQDLAHGEQGQDLVEYAMLVSLIAVTMIASISSIATTLVLAFSNISTSLS